MDGGLLISTPIFDVNDLGFVPPSDGLGHSKSRAFFAGSRPRELGSFQAFQVKLRQKLVGPGMAVGSMVGMGI